MRLDTRTRAKLCADNQRLTAEVERLQQDLWRSTENRVKLKARIADLENRFPSDHRDYARELVSLVPSLLPGAHMDPVLPPTEWAAKRVRELLAEFKPTE
jgi:hypothetical protein